MDANNQQEKKTKKGLFAWLSRIARGGRRGTGISGGRAVSAGVPKTVNMPSVSTLSGAARGGGGLLSRIVTALRLPSVLATRAGVMGLILAGVTIATGMAAMSGFINSPSKAAYNPGLFNNSYYDSLVSQAEKDRMSRGPEDSASGNSLDMLQQQFETDKSAGEEAEAGEESAIAEHGAAPDKSRTTPTSSLPAKAPSATGGGAARGFGSSGFNFGGGGGGSSGSLGGSKAASPSTGGLSDGGRTRGAAYSGSMRGGTALGRNALLQAKSGKKSMGAAGGMMGKQAAASMFYDGGGTVGGDVAAVNGEGVGGAGSPEGAGAGMSDDSSSSVEPPSPSSPESASGGGGGGGGEEATESEPETVGDKTPWKNLSAAAVATAVTGAALCAAIFGLGKLRTKVAAGNPTLAAIILAAQLALLAMVLAATALLVMMGNKLLKDWGQQKEGIVTIAAGALIGALGLVAIIMGNMGFKDAKLAAQAAGKAGKAISPLAKGAILGVGGIGGTIAGVASFLGLGGMEGGSGLESMVSSDNQVQNPDNYSDKKDAGNFNSFIQGGQS